MKKVIAMLAAARAALFVWRRRSQPSNRQRAMNRGRAGVASGVQRARSGVEQVRLRVGRRRKP